MWKSDGQFTNLVEVLKIKTFILHSLDISGSQRVRRFNSNFDAICVIYIGYSPSLKKGSRIEFTVGFLRRVLEWATWLGHQPIAKLKDKCPFPNETTFIYAM